MFYLRLRDVVSNEVLDEVGTSVIPEAGADLVVQGYGDYRAHYSVVSVGTWRFAQDATLDCVLAYVNVFVVRAPAHFDVYSDES